MTPHNIAIIGAGNMGASLLGGLLNKNYPAENLWITDASDEKLNDLNNRFKKKFHVTSNNLDAAEKADVILFAVKPLTLPAVARELSGLIQRNTPLIISIAAGVREETIQHCIGGKIAIVRVMSNTPAMLGCGATALFANAYVSNDERNLAESILRAVGVTVWLEKETLLDAVTALSGSGPAYFFFIMEALQEAGEKLGLEPSVARLLTLETAYGAARMALDSDHSLAELRRQVTSPGGTTEQAIRVLEEKHLPDILMNALYAANARAQELSDMFRKEMES